jgi:hypothetical protein
VVHQEHLGQWYITFLRMNYESEVAYYTNATFYGDSRYVELESWSSISSATFDTGVIVISQEK